jgi:hypothetical protein
MQRFHRTAAENSLLLQGQQTNDYAEFQRLMSETDPTALRYLGVMIYGAKKQVLRILDRYILLRPA